MFCCVCQKSSLTTTTPKKLSLEIVTLEEICFVFLLKNRRSNLSRKKKDQEEKKKRIGKKNCKQRRQIFMLDWTMWRKLDTNKKLWRAEQNLALFRSWQKKCRCDVIQIYNIVKSVRRNKTTLFLFQFN